MLWKNIFLRKDHLFFAKNTHIENHFVIGCLIDLAFLHFAIWAYPVPLLTKHTFKVPLCSFSTNFGQKSESDFNVN